MNYFIQYPLYPVCNLKCAYCLHGRWRFIDAKPEYAWSIDQYRLWRDICLEPDANLVIHLASGEPSFGANKRPVERLFAETERERFDILTNGTCPIPDVWIRNQHRIDRIGATFHRKILQQSQGMVFYSNVMKMRDAGLPVYVKELAFRSTFHKTLKARDEWEKQGIPFKIQHYRQMDCEFDEDGNLDEQIVRNIDPEFLSYDYDADQCFCRKGFEGIILRFDGRILACWHNQKVIGSIQDKTYTPGAKTYKYVSKSGKTRCRVCLAGEPFDHSLGQTIGELFRNNRKEQGMNQKGPDKTISIEALTFSSRKRIEDSVSKIGEVLDELQTVVEQQNALIQKQSIEIKELSEMLQVFQKRENPIKDNPVLQGAGLAGPQEA